MDYKRSRRVSLKANVEFNERWLQQQIVSDVEILGLGDLDVKDVERRQPKSGRLDVLLFEAETNTRYEVEIQLGATDESHIIRTLEYWDNERRRFPQYEHIAVIVAEEITGRFLNVINLFNQSIPLIAIQMSALEVDGALTLNATRVLDLALPATEEEDESGHETDRAYWEQRSSRQVMGLMDQVLDLINAGGTGLALKYNKHYVGLQRDGVADNFVTFRPRRPHLVIEWRIDRSEELDARLEATGMALLPYDKRWRRYRAQLAPAEFKRFHLTIVELIGMARGLDAVTPTDEL